MTVGQMYENRRTKKVGVVEERDDKCKTLLLRDEDGKSFNVTFSTFKSNWRKYQGDKAIKTSTQAEEERREAESAKEDVKKPSKSKVSREDLFKATKAIQKIIESVVKENYDGIAVKVVSRGGISLRVRNRSKAEFWARPGEDAFNVVVRDEVYDVLDESLKDEEKYTIRYMENWNLRRDIRGIPVSDVENTARLVADAIVEIESKED